MTTVNERAWLDTIAWAEGANYNTLFGGKTFSDFSWHPLASRAIKLPNGKTTSAAGRYQFERDTWDGIANRIKAVLGYVNFGPAAQDEGALILTQDKGALASINAGIVGYTAKNLATVWEGFKGKSASQIQAYFDADRSKLLAGGSAATNGAMATDVTRTRNTSAPVNEEARKAVITAVAGIVILVAVLMMSGNLRG